LTLIFAEMPHAIKIYRRLTFKSIAVPLAAFAVAGSSLAAEALPSKPIRIVVPFTPGGTTDVLARILATRLQESLGQIIIVDNKPGAGGNIGAAEVAKSAPDGHTLLLRTPGPLAINPSLFKSMAYKPERDFTAIGQLIALQPVLVVLPNSPLKSVADVISTAKAQGKLLYASAGNGTTPHLAAELMASITGIELQQIAYKGYAPALTDLLGGHVPLMFANIAGVAGMLRDGKVRAIAVTGPARSKLLPDVPTVAELGPAGYAVSAWAGLVAPAGTHHHSAQRRTEQGTCHARPRRSHAAAFSRSGTWHS